MQLTESLLSKQGLSKERVARCYAIKKLLAMAADFYGTNLSEAQDEMWSVVLSKYESQLVQQALAELMENPKQVFMPKPAEIMVVCDSLSRRAGLAERAKPKVSQTPKCDPDLYKKRMGILIKAMQEGRQVTPEELGINMALATEGCTMCDDNGVVFMVRHAGKSVYDYTFKCLCEKGKHCPFPYPEVDVNFGLPEWELHSDWRKHA